MVILTAHHRSARWTAPWTSSRMPSARTLPLDCAFMLIALKVSKPPTWISSKMMTCPNPLQYVGSVRRDQSRDAHRAGRREECRDQRRAVRADPRHRQHEQQCADDLDKGGSAAGLGQADRRPR